MATTSAAQPTPVTENVSLRIDGREITVKDGTTILDAAAELEIEMPARTPRRACDRARRVWRSPRPAIAWTATAPR
jgi:hypothetical protein